MNTSHRSNSSNKSKQLQTQSLNKGGIFQRLNSSIPLNEFGLPDHIYQADIIPTDWDSNHYSQEDRINILGAASLQLTFDHGYPAINESHPLWERLPGESDDAFNAFMIYLELPEKTNHENPIRLLPMVAAVVKQDISKITEYCHIFCWHWRGKAYDLFNIAALRKQREQRLMSIEGKHFTFAENLLNKVLKLAEHKLNVAITTAGTEDDVDDTKLKDLVDMADKLSKIQRVSLGLSASGTAVNIHVDGPRHGTVNDQMKHIARESQNESTTSKRSPEIDRLLNNPDDLTKVQSLILKTYSDTNSSYHSSLSSDEEIIDVDPNNSDDEDSK